MKELEVNINSIPKTELQVKKKQEIEYVLEGTITPRNGHAVYEVNTVTGEVRHAEYEHVPAIFSRLKAFIPPNRRLIVKADCVYIPALNIGNAKKKFLKDSRQSSYYDRQAPMSLSETFY